MSATMPHWLDARARISPNKLAIETETRSITFKELENESKQLAFKLNELGIKKGDHIAVLSKNSIDYIVIIYALSYLEAVTVLLNTRLTEVELTYQVKKSKAKLVLADSAYLDLNLDCPIHSFEEISKLKQKPIKLSEEIKLDRPFTMMFTSGTTGNPKAVLHKYQHHFYSATASVFNMGLHANDKWLSSLPIFHVGGFSVFIKSVLYGMPVYLMNKYDKEVVFRVIHEKNITIVSFVTLMLVDYLELLNQQSYQSSNQLRAVLLGGGSVAEHVLTQAIEAKLNVLQSFGMTETASQIASLSSEDALRKQGSAGKALLPAKIKINNPDDKGVGEILVKGPMVIQSYYNLSNQSDFEAGWLKTGDIGYLDDEAFLYVLERRSDLIISGGENIYPTEVENTILAHTLIKEIAVVGKADDKWGEVPVAFICSNKKYTLNELYTLLKPKLAKYKWPKEIIYLKKLPRTASGKLKRHELKSYL